MLDTVRHVLTRARILDLTDVHVVTPEDVPNVGWLRPGSPSRGQQAFGRALLEQHMFVAIPSAVTQESWNLLFNPARAAGRYELETQKRFALANRAPCDPKTLTRAARDFAEQNPVFAMEAGLAALQWLVQGYGYEITSADVWAAHSNTIKAAEKAGRGDEVRSRIRALVDNEQPPKQFVADIIGRASGLP